MSWHLYAKCPHCHEMHIGFNQTHNTNEMMRQAGAGPDDFDGLTLGQARRKMTGLIEALESDPTRFRTLNPSNGWGGYDTLVPKLKELLTKMEELSTDCIVTVNM